MNRPQIQLVNGPYDGRMLDDSGAVVIRLALSSDGTVEGAMLGEACYEPNAERTLAFWEGNHWLGTLVAVMPC